MEDFSASVDALVDETDHAAVAAHEPTSEEVKRECDLWHSALRNQAAPYLSEMHHAVGVTDLSDVLHELKWLDVAGYQGVTLNSAKHFTQAAARA